MDNKISYRLSVKLKKQFIGFFAVGFLAGLTLYQAVFFFLLEKESGLYIIGKIAAFLLIVILIIFIRNITMKLINTNTDIL